VDKSLGKKTAEKGGGKKVQRKESGGRGLAKTETQRARNPKKYESLPKKGSQAVEPNTTKIPNRKDEKKTLSRRVGQNLGRKLGFQKKKRT